MNDSPMVVIYQIPAIRGNALVCSMPHLSDPSNWLVEQIRDGSDAVYFG